MWIYKLAHQDINMSIQWSVVLITGSAQGAGPRIALRLASTSLSMISPPNIIIAIETESLQRNTFIRVIPDVSEEDTSMVVCAVEHTW
jgi:hypothetical protein